MLSRQLKRGLSALLVVLLVVLAAVFAAGCYSLVPDVSWTGEDGGREAAVDADAGDVAAADVAEVSDDRPDAADVPLASDADVTVAADASDVTPPVDVADGGSADASDVPFADRPDAADVADVQICPMGQAFCGGRCVNTASDSVNCGRCGGVCTVGACVSGGCRIDVVAEAAIRYQLDAASGLTFSETRAISRATYVMEGDPFVGSYAVSVGGAYTIARTLFVFSVSSSSGVLSSVCLSFRLDPADMARMTMAGPIQQVCIVSYDEARPLATYGVGDFNLPYWRMGTPFGCRAVTDFSTGAPQAICLNSDGTRHVASRLAVGSQLRLGAVSQYDQADSAPGARVDGRFPGAFIDPSVRLQLTRSP